MTELPQIATDNFKKFLTFLGIAIMYLSQSGESEYREDVRNDLDRNTEVLYKVNLDNFRSTLYDYKLLTELMDHKLLVTKDFNKISEFGWKISKNSADSGRAVIAVYRLKYVDTTSKLISQRIANLVLKLDTLSPQLELFEKNIETAEKILDIEDNLTYRIFMYKFWTVLGFFLFSTGFFLWGKDEFKTNHKL